MAYQAQATHAQDVSSFDLTSTHRLPTVSAADALESLDTDPTRFISTGLPALDEALNHASPPHPGIRRGQVVEVWGPPGSGKTTFAMQLAANTLREGNQVVWVGTLRDVVNSPRISSQRTATPSATELIHNLVHYSTPTLAHLIGLLCKPAASSIPSNASLVIIDTLSCLVNHAFPKNIESRQASKGPGPGPSARRFQVLQFVISALQKLSATRDLLVVVLSQCATRMQAERGATLIPAINAGTWEQGIATRLVLFKDWMTKGDVVRDTYLVAVQKTNGKPNPNGIGPVFAFEVDSAGLVGVELDRNQSSLSFKSTPRQKRKLGQTDFEIVDSEDEDYGWEDTDELPRMPSQVQGSEDLLLGPADADGDEYESEEDSERQVLLRESPAPTDPEQSSDGGHGF
ncbi:P-loop containing nucleoside triphosphate hydrolase protein [Biscogniauxia sp. FL1348]|nr:P-loop containing nucleoside triphosphate hydrolase protein [Biscogniauxia sp. FL1348]